MRTSYLLSDLCSIIVTYQSNVEDLTENFKRQIDNFHQIIIVNNTPQINLSQFKAKHVRLINNPSNIGLAAALNVGILEAKKLGFKITLISKAYVYHKRRISWSKFYKQVYNFGLVRPILNTWHPESTKITYWFPTLFCLGFVFSVILFMFNINWPIVSYGLYFGLVFIISLFSTKHLIVASLSLFAIAIQFIGYGYGFLKSTLALKIFNRKPEKQFPGLFFKSK
jgi:glycosyltransferase involved in cell wall biosynthesis